MANGDIVYGRFPITIDSSASADTALTTVLDGLFNDIQFNDIHTQLVFDKGTRTKATVVIVALAEG